MANNSIKLTLGYEGTDFTRFKSAKKVATTTRYLDLTN